MADKLLPIVSGEVLEEDVILSMADLCRVCHLTVDEIYILVDEGIVEPVEDNRPHWRFYGTCVRRVHRAIQLRSDLGVNWAGAALALDLIDELEELRNRLRRFEESE
ncbi:MAG: chaperone modulator CbpM [Gammaproteobacteria bacterium]|jgi:chaperone modulatory protein CbpM